MNSIQEDLRLSDLLDWLRSHEKTQEGYNEKFDELMELIRGIDRINIREFVDNKLADNMESFIKWDNEFFQGLNSSEQIEFFIDSGLNWPGVWTRNMFRLTPAFVKQGVKIPDNLKKLYAESRKCFIFEQFNSAIVLSRAIIEIALKNKIGLSVESKHWTAGEILDRAYEKKIIKDSAYWIGSKVITKANEILHQGRDVQHQETLNAIDHTKQFLEDLFG
jgi:hypothetical protein